MAVLFLFLFFFAFALTIVYIFAVSRLRAQLEQKAPDYWSRIGRATTFGKGQALGIINNLYTREMSEVCGGMGASSWLGSVRWLFPITMVLNTGVILLIARLHAQG
ncbi:hypothetical protein [Lysobacter solisilvae (ex Woo and Kim 2020)]|uniref:Uncharacterized protein n=1 Tax=Agrilutibacter terrestris TaxID=2865112 RepID=A0A7H0FVW3_9GAMM|nr:hypothetical protein [Lysobacter terrestris]QNP40179.1 hypothetical protein H8B22_11870 [Lysobacter terrestris]